MTKKESKVKFQALQDMSFFTIRSSPSRFTCEGFLLLWKGCMLGLICSGAPTAHSRPFLEVKQMVEQLVSLSQKEGLIMRFHAIAECQLPNAAGPPVALADQLTSWTHLHADHGSAARERTLAILVAQDGTNSVPPLLSRLCLGAPRTRDPNSNPQCESTQSVLAECWGASNALDHNGLQWSQMERLWRIGLAWMGLQSKRLERGPTTWQLWICGCTAWALWSLAIKWEQCTGDPRTWGKVHHPANLARWMVCCRKHCCCFQWSLDIQGLPIG